MKIQLEPGPSSSATHSLTRPSATLNRRYVSRPTTLAIEEAARSIQSSHNSSHETAPTPSRLVNLRVRDVDLAKARAAAEKAQHDAMQYQAYSASAFMPRALPSQITESGDQIAYNNNYAPAYAEPQITSQTYDYPELPATSPMQTTNTTKPVTSISPVNYYGYTEDYALSEPPSMVSNVAPISDTSSTTPATPEIDTKALAMNIAADYTAATLEATMSSLPEYTSRDTDKLSAAITEQHASDSIDEIARTASEAIASIRSATDPADIATQIDSLQDFAEQIKTSNNLPEIAELGATIDKFIAIARKSTGIKEETAKKKALLSSKADRAASKVAKSSAKISTQQAKMHPTATVKRKATVSKHTTSARPTLSRAPRSTKPATQRRAPSKPSTSTQIDKEAALRRALNSVAQMDDAPSKSKKSARPAIKRKSGNGKRFAIAFGCAVLCVAAIIYFVGANIPDISVRVAAMQTGIEASYPSYVPRGYSLKNISSEDAKISLTFSDPDNNSFTLIEEKSSWDSTALLRNYVEPTWQTSYSTTHEQGITIYIYGSNAAWVNGGVLYKINSQSNSLTKKQLRNIVTSMQ